MPILKKKKLAQVTPLSTYVYLCVIEVLGFYNTCTVQR